MIIVRWLRLSWTLARIERPTSRSGHASAAGTLGSAAALRLAHHLLNWVQHCRWQQQAQCSHTTEIAATIRSLSCCRCATQASRCRRNGFTALCCRQALPCCSFEPFAIVIPPPVVRRLKEAGLRTVTASVSQQRARPRQLPGSKHTMAKHEPYNLRLQVCTTRGQALAESGMVNTS